MGSKDLHQKLLDEIFEFVDNTEELFEIPNIKSDEFLDLIEKVYSYKHRAALILAQYNQQVENGGHRQYHDNGYDFKVNELIKIIQFGKDNIHKDFEKIYNIIIDFDDIGTPEDYESFEEIVVGCEYCDGIGYIGDDEDELICQHCEGDGRIFEVDEIDGFEEFSNLCEPLDHKYYNIKNRLELYNELLSKIEKENK